MNAPSIEQRPDGCLGGLSILGAALIVSAMILLAGGMLPLLALFLPIVVVVTMIVSLMIGLPIFLLLGRLGLTNWATVAFGGFFTGAVLPAALILGEPLSHTGRIGTLVTIAGQRYLVDDWVPEASVTVGFGLAGTIGALLAWRIFLGSRKPRTRLFHIGTLFLIVAAIGASASVHMLLTDNSCHNSLRGGRLSVAPVAAFNVHLSRNDWPELRSEFRRFARDNGWSFELGPAEYYRPPFLDIDICTASGTQISAASPGENDLDIPISVYQPQGGVGWRQPFHAFQQRIESRWPGSVSYPFQPPPPWAPTQRAKAASR